jgi:glycerol-3-phosphate O-acyltransferase
LTARHRVREKQSPVAAERPLVAYEPNFLLSWLYDRFFAHVEVDESWVRAVREAEARGTVVYVLRNLSFVDFFALDHLTKRFELPQVRFANDLGLWLLEPMGRGWLQALRPPKEEDDVRDLRRAVEAGASAALFLKRPAHLLEGKARGKTEGDPYLRTLFQTQRASKKPILLVPQVFIWSKLPDARKHTVFDALLGPREWPGRLRTLAQFLGNYRDVTLRAGQPIELDAFLAQEGKDPDGVDVPDDVLVRRLTYTLLRRLERQRRSVLGPTKKPADRVRDEVIRSPKLAKVVRDLAGEGKDGQDAIRRRALQMIEEMEASLDMASVSVIGAAFERVLHRMFREVEVDMEGLERVRQATKEGSVVFLPSHKSHVDYMVLSHIFYKNRIGLPLIAAGDNLNFFPAGPLFRRAGAFFIRRNFFGDKLYAAVVDAYVRRIIKDGWSLEFFLEGGRSRTGKLLTPKLGILSIVVDAALGIGGRKTTFCPISIGYERPVEEASYVRELLGGEKQKEDATNLFRTAGVIADRYGRISVQFGKLISLDEMRREVEGPKNGAPLPPAKRRTIVTRLAHRVMHEINRVTAVTPGALVATALLTQGRRGLAHEDLLLTCERLATSLHGFGARFSGSLLVRPGSKELRRGAIVEAIELFVKTGKVQVLSAGSTLGVGRSKTQIPGDGAVYVVREEGRIALDIAKNLVVHFFVSRAMIATGMLVTSGPVPRETLRERVEGLSRLFKYEFTYRPDATFDRIFEDELAAMMANGEVRETEAGLVPGSDGRAQLVMAARILATFVEGYGVAAATLPVLLKGPLAPKDLAKRGLATGERLYLAGEVERREAVSRSLLENAFSAFVDEGYLVRVDGKYALADSFNTAEALQAVEHRLALFTTGRGASLETVPPPP